MATRCAVLLFLLLLSGCTPSSLGTSNSGASSTLRLALQAEPPHLDWTDSTNNLISVGWIQQPLLEELFGVSKNLDYATELLAAQPDIVTNKDGSVTIRYRLREGLTWSDGDDLTSEDVEYTYRIAIEGCPLKADGSIADDASVENGCVRPAFRTGMEFIRNFEVTSSTEFSVEFASYYAGWREIFGPILASHAYGENAAEVTENLQSMRGPDGPLPTSGPFVLTGWDRGLAMTLERNDFYHGSTNPDARNQGIAQVEQIEVQFNPDLDSQINALLAGEIDVIMPSTPDEALGKLKKSDRFVLSAEPGPKYEHWGLNVLNKHLSKAHVREAIAFAIDKQEVISVLYEPLYGDRVDPAGLGNAFWMPNQDAYIDHQERYAVADIGSAEAALAAAGYSRGSDGVFAHPDDGPLTLRISTPPGNRLRDLQLELMASQLEKAGISLKIEPGPVQFFADTITSDEALLAARTKGVEGDPNVWDIVQFSWTGGPWPGLLGNGFRATGDGNVYGFADPAYDSTLSVCNELIDDDKRDECYNEADKHVTTLEKGDSGLFVIPITQQPSFFGHNNVTVAEAPIAPDSVSGGPLANAADYRLKK